MGDPQQDIAEILIETLKERGWNCGGYKASSARDGHPAEVELYKWCNAPVGDPRRKHFTVYGVEQSKEELEAGRATRRISQMPTRISFRRIEDPRQAVTAAVEYWMTHDLTLDLAEKLEQTGDTSYFIP